MFSACGDASFDSHYLIPPKAVLIFLAILPLMKAAVFILRLRDLDFLARMWLPKARSRAILPVPVILTRFAVPLCVLSLGIELL